ncbi:uncharacterized protein LOC144153176 [Haemaphysalis longicornis]
MGGSWVVRVRYQYYGEARRPVAEAKVVNGFWLLFYVLVGNRFFEEDARNNWTDPGEEKRQAIAAAELHSGLSDVESKNTSAQASADVSKEAPPNATQMNIIGELPVSGYVFDLIFGTETALNLASDIMMQVSLCSWKSPGTKVMLRVFFGWNCFSTGLCYLASLFHADFDSRIAEYDPTEENDVDEPTFREALKYANIFMYTVVLVVKISVLCCIFMFLHNWDTLWKEPDGQQGHAFGVPAGWPGGYPREQPRATATQGASSAGGDTTMTDPSE